MKRLWIRLGFSFSIIFFLVINVQAGDAIAGKVSIIKGKVFLTRGLTKISLKKDDTILESDIIESEVGTARITMIDSNLVDVYPRSKVEISKYIFKPSQDQKEVELKVDFGKIKSTVNQKYDGAKNKYQVKTPSAVAGVRGTVFTTEYDAANKISKIITIEGLVAVTKIIDREKPSPPVFVRPNQVVRVDIEKAQTEQPRELNPEEKDQRKKEDKDLGYQYDPKKEPVLDQTRQSLDNLKLDPEKAKKMIVKEVKEIQEPVKEIKNNLKDTTRDFREDKQEQQSRQEQERRQNEAEKEQARKQKQIEDEQQKKQIKLEEAQKIAEAARLAAEAAKRAESIIAPISPPNTETTPLPGTYPPKN